MWSVYILRCADGALYVGHTSDLESRVARHLEGRGPAFTAARLPVALVYHEVTHGSIAAVQRERQIKRWTRAKKEALIAGDFHTLHSLSRRRQPSSTQEA